MKDLSTIQATMPQSGPLSIRLFDMSERFMSVIVDEIAEEGTHTYTFSRKSLAAGTYFLRMETSDGEMTSKIVIE